MAIETEARATQQKASGSSFYAAMRLMPKAEREAMYAIYAFCRAVDDIADNGWDSQEVLKKIERTGHIALEVHSNGPSDKLGKDRWAPGAVCRWRNISVKTLA